MSLKVNECSDEKLGYDYVPLLIQFAWISHSSRVTTMSPSIVDALSMCLDGPRRARKRAIRNRDYQVSDLVRTSLWHFYIA